MAAEKNIRPLTFADLAGQDKAKKMLNIYIKASQMKGECLDHVLISGPSGCGKTTIANIIANESGQNIKVYSGPAIKKPEDMADILMNIQENDIVFIDEIHALPKKVQEQLYFGMEQFVTDVCIDGQATRLSLPHFTCIGATTDLGGLAEPCRMRFPIQVALTPYSEDTMTSLVKNVFRAMNVDCPDDCAAIIGGCTRGIPRNANSYCRRIYDFALVLNDGRINASVVEQAFDFMDINKFGLSKSDMNYLRYLCDAHASVGVDTIATSIGMDKLSVETVIEPYLLQKKLVQKTPRGRRATEKAFEILGY